MTPGEISAKAPDVPTEAGEKKSGIHVDLSHLGRALSAGPGGSQSASEAKLKRIDESDLPNEVKELMKRIVELKEALKEKQAQLQKVMQDKSLSDEQRQQKVAALQSEISHLSSALQDAMGMLTDTISKMGLEDEAAIEIAALIT